MTQKPDSLQILFKTLRHWKLIVACVIVAAGIAVGLTLVQTKKYTSKAQLFVSTQGSTAAADALTSAFAGSEFSTARVQSYVDLVSSPEISRPVIRDLGLNMTRRQFDSEVSATAQANTVLLNLSVVDPNPVLAQRIAAAVAQQYIAVIQTLETTPGQASPVRVSVSSPATLPSTPSSPQKTLNIALGVILGLLIGSGLAQLRERLDNSIESDEELQTDFGLQVLSHVPYDANVREGLASLGGSSATGRREALRGLRTALRYVDVDNPPHVIVITSCRPGDGKTTTCASLAAVLADQGQDVAVVEGDLRRPKLRQYLGNLPEGEGVSEVLGEGRKLETLMRTIDRSDGPASAGKLDLLGAGAVVPNPTELLGSHRMAALVEDLRALYDLVIIDAPPLLPVTDAVVLSTIVDGVLLVVEPRKTTRNELQRAVGLLRQVDARLLGAVINKTSAKDRHGYGYGYGYEYGYATAAPTEAKSSTGGTDN